MSRPTLLSVVQTVLDAIDGDEVNSINDTIESKQVAQLVARTYDNIDAKADLPIENRLFSFIGTSPATPTMMTKPSYIDRVDWFRYNCIKEGETAANYREIKYLLPEEFYRTILEFNQNDSNVGTFSVTKDGSTVPYFYQNDQAPTYWTSFDDEVIITDSYDSALDANLQMSKSVAYGRLINVFQFTDGYVIDISDDQFPLLINETIALAWAEMKQTQNARAEKMARFQWIGTMKSKRNIKVQNTLLNLPDYGRK